MKKNIPAFNNDLETIFQGFNQLNILVVGDLILDQYIWGKVDRISPEAPVPIVTVNRKENRLGGAGNVAANLAALECPVTLAGVCGTDQAGVDLLALCRQMNLPTIIENLPVRRTSCKARIIAQHQQLMRVDEETIEPVGKKQVDALLGKITAVANQFDAVILSDYAKGLLTEHFIQSVLRLFPGKPVMIDPKGFNYLKYHNATTIKPNFKEFCAAVRHPELTISEIEPLARRLVDELGLKGLIVTLGEQGVFVLDENDRCAVIPTKAREVFDVSGAGDTFIAVFTAALNISKDWMLSAEAANLASGIAVSKVGTATVSVAEILASK
ncbi:MAG: bifunctional ADP-heptose synthase [Candidatus Neomarinimicrobiota bacterium]